MAALVVKGIVDEWQERRRKRREAVESSFVGIGMVVGAVVVVVVVVGVGIADSTWADETGRVGAELVVVPSGLTFSKPFRLFVHSLHGTDFGPEIKLV
jgi:hypothetical protein